MGTPQVEILRIAPSHEPLLAALFARIAADPSAARFHPHPFTAEEAHRVARHGGRDLYCGLFSPEGIGGYGMLRGWDAGYDMPRLGIYVLPELRGKGAARSLMLHLHRAAHANGAKAVQLTVYPENLPAVSLYRSMGYVFGATPLPGGRIVGDLALDGGATRQRGKA